MAYRSGATARRSMIRLHIGLLRVRRCVTCWDAISSDRPKERWRCRCNPAANLFDLPINSTVTCADTALLAVTHGRVGVDVEQLRGR